MADNKEGKESSIDMSGYLEKGQPLSELKPTPEPGEIIQASQPRSEVVMDSMPVSEIRPTPSPDAGEKPPSDKK